MPYAVNQSLVFLPVLAVVALTFVAFVRLAVGRAVAAKDGFDGTYYRAHLGKNEPEGAIVGARHWGNLFELPTLFYAGCIAAFVLGGVGQWTLGFAWAYVAARVAQSAVHLSYNNPAHRGMAFALGVIFVFALWANVALTVFAGL